MNTFNKLILALLMAVSTVAMIGCGSSSVTMDSYHAAKQASLETVKAGQFDNGRMWTFEYPPMDWFQEAYSFRPDQQWMDDVRMSSLKFATWCSASFVSADGLVMTNHHCSRNPIVDVQKEGEKLLETGFYAATLSDERKVPGLFVEQLVNIKDVTAEVHAAIEAGKTDEEKVSMRQEVISRIQKQAEEETKMRAQVVSLYQGGKYSLYLFKRFTDVRLVFAPELAMGHYGGEWDNFTYPRYAQDFTFFRVYDDDGKPLRTNNYFKWSSAGANPGDAVFVVGNPGRTNRLNTVAQLEFSRDIQYPFTHKLLIDRMDVLNEYVKLHPEKKDAMITQKLSIANGLKAYTGRLSGLRDDVLMQRRKDFEKQFRSAINGKPDLRAKYGHLWDEIAESRNKVRAVANDLFGLRTSGLGVSQLFSRAAGIVKFAAQIALPEDKREKPYQGTVLDVTKRALTKALTLDNTMELLTLVKQLESMKNLLGANDPVLQMALKGETPEQAAKRMMSASVLVDSMKSSALMSDLASINTSSDPFIQLARLAIPRLDKATQVTNEISARDQVNAVEIGRALFSVYGTSIPPDATFTLRLADGVVQGFEYNGTKAPAFTTYYGMYDRNRSHKGEEDWHLPNRWLNPPAEFDLGTPCNFVSTNDIIGGNSGSPIVNKNKEIVGIVFDGNIESLPGDFIFAEDAGNRTVSVHSAGILAVVKHIYGAGRIARELEQGKLVQQ